MAPIMAHWDEERDTVRVEMMRKCGPLAREYQHLIDEYEKTGDDICWNAFVDAIRRAVRKSYPQLKD